MSSRHTHITKDATSDLARLLYEAEQSKRAEARKYRIVGAGLWASPFVFLALLLWMVL